MTKRTAPAAGTVDRVQAVLVGWLVLVFLLGGSARADVESLTIVRPLSVLVLAYGLAGITREQIASHRWLFALAGAWLALHLVQLVPLPPRLWQALPGRDIVIEVDRAAGIAGGWRPLSLLPAGTRNAAWSLLAPLGVLVLGARMSADQRGRLLPLLIGLGLFSAVLGGLQLLGDPQGAIYFYRITNAGSAVGLFANRNHQAIFLASLAPMLFVWAALRSRDTAAAAARWRWWAVAAAAALPAIPLILVTGSRAGLVAGLLCLLAVPAILWDRLGSGLRRARLLLLPLLAMAALAGATVLLGRGLAFERLVGSSGDDELRLRAIGTLLRMLGQYWPFGSGFGSFTEVYEIHEPQELLGPAYFNHAHNDWLELLLTGGLPAAAIAAAAIAAWFVRLPGLLRACPPDRDADEMLLARLGMLVLAMLALASLGDYPLRTPSLACFAAVAALWACPARHPCRAPAA